MHRSNSCSAALTRQVRKDRIGAQIFRPFDAWASSRAASPCVEGRRDAWRSILRDHARASSDVSRHRRRNPRRRVARAGRSQSRFRLPSLARPASSPDVHVGLDVARLQPARQPEASRLPLAHSRQRLLVPVPVLAWSRLARFACERRRDDASGEGSNEPPGQRDLLASRKTLLTLRRHARPPFRLPPRHRRRSAQLGAGRALYAGDDGVASRGAPQRAQHAPRARAGGRRHCHRRHRAHPVAAVAGHAEPAASAAAGVLCRARRPVVDRRSARALARRPLHCPGRGGGAVPGLAGAGGPRVPHPSRCRGARRSRALPGCGSSISSTSWTASTGWRGARPSPWRSATCCWRPLPASVAPSGPWR